MPFKRVSGPRITRTGATRVSELRDGSASTYEITPEDFGFSRADAGDLKGGDAKTNAEIVRSVLSGEPGARRDIVLLNAAAGIVAGGLAGDMSGGVEAARQAVDSGRAMEKLEGLKTASRGRT